MLYFVEFAIACCIVAGVAFWGLALLSPVICALGFAAFAVWMLKIEAGHGLAITGGTAALLLVVTRVLS